MFDEVIPSSLFDVELAFLEVGRWEWGVDVFAGHASFALNFDFEVPDESPSGSNATLTFFLESPGPNVCVGPFGGELAAGKAGLSGGERLAGQGVDDSVVRQIRPGIFERNGRLYGADGGAPVRGLPGDELLASGGGLPVTGRTAVIGERMSRVRALADEYGYATMPNLPKDMPTVQKLAANKAWIRARMDEGYTIVDLGPAPGYTNYPYITSPYYRMELEQIMGRGYSRWLPIWGAY